MEILTHHMTINHKGPLCNINWPFWLTAILADDKGYFASVHKPQDTPLGIFVYIHSTGVFKRLKPHPSNVRHSHFIHLQLTPDTQTPGD
jgi:hypothetical protein